MLRRNAKTVHPICTIFVAILFLCSSRTGFAQAPKIDGGLVVALATNIFSVASVNTNLTDNNFVGSLTIRWKDGLPNLGVIVLVFGLLKTIVLYLFLENFQPR